MMDVPFAPYVTLAFVWAAYAVDLLAGDPGWLPHPVVIMGKVISLLERLLNRPGLSPRAARLGGAFTVALTVCASYAVTWALLLAAGQAGIWASGIAWVWLLSTTLAARGLGDAALAVAKPLEAGDLTEGRRQVGFIVGRDTDAMCESEVARAAVETVAENMSDGVVAPLFWGVLGGPPLAMAYKAINTLDSMIGHMDERYLYFGWAAARLDDWANLIPARLSGFLLAVASWLSGRGFLAPFRAMGKWAKLHPSPNGGYPESAMAGSLQVRLGGVNYYDGVPERRAEMGVAANPLGPWAIRASVRLMHLGSLLGVALLTGIAAALAAATSR